MVFSNHLLLKIRELNKFGITHSCYPNSGYNSNNELITIELIRPGEPISIDFSTLFVGDTTLFQCTCGHIGCRNRILGFNFLPVIIQEKYLEAGVAVIIRSAYENG